MTTRLILVRHGETVANAQMKYQGRIDALLSKKGIAQAKLVAKRLSREPIQAVYSSGLKRSFATAAFIAKRHDLKVKMNPQFNERNYGLWEDLTHEQISQRFPHIYKLWLQQPDKAVIPQGETIKQVQRRAVTALKELIVKHKGQTIVLVGHGGMNRTLLLYLLKMDLNDFWSLRQDNGAINMIEFNHRRPTVTLVNETCFLHASQKSHETY
jgi:alpha-ribazole phosphatase